MAGLPDTPPPTDEFGNSERAIRLVAIAAHARGDFEAERIALDRLALMERGRLMSKPRHRCPDCGAFCKPIWLPPPALGTDPKWRCRKCGSRT